MTLHWRIPNLQSASPVSAGPWMISRHHCVRIKNIYLFHQFVHVYNFVGGIKKHIITWVVRPLIPVISLRSLFADLTIDPTPKV